MYLQKGQDWRRRLVNPHGRDKCGAPQMLGVLPMRVTTEAVAALPMVISVKRTWPTVIMKWTNARALFIW